MKLPVDIVDPCVCLYTAFLSSSKITPTALRHVPKIKDDESSLMRLVLILTLTDVSDHPLVVKHQRFHDHVTIEICMWIHIRFTFEQCIYCFIHKYSPLLCILLPFIANVLEQYKKVHPLIFAGGYIQGLSVIVAMNPHNFLVDLLIKHKSVFTLLDLNWRKDIAILRNVSSKRMQPNLNIYKIKIFAKCKYLQNVNICKI